MGKEAARIRTRERRPRSEQTLWGVFVGMCRNHMDKEDGGVNGRHDMTDDRQSSPKGGRTPGSTVSGFFSFWTCRWVGQTE
jgi:hypothetical protein